MRAKWSQMPPDAPRCLVGVVFGRLGCQWLSLVPVLAPHGHNFGAAENVFQGSKTFSGLLIDAIWGRVVCHWFPVAFISGPLGTIAGPRNVFQPVLEDSFQLIMMHGSRNEGHRETRADKTSQNCVNKQDRKCLSAPDSYGAPELCSGVPKREPRGANATPNGKELCQQVRPKMSSSALLIKLHSASATATATVTAMATDSATATASQLSLRFI